MRQLGILTIAAVLALLGPALAEDSCPPGQKLFAHKLLATAPVCVPQKPARAAFIDQTVAFAVALGIPTITRSYYSDMVLADFPGLADRLDAASMTDVGHTWEMNGETLLNAQPDLVVSSIYWDAANGFAEALAPTVVIDPDRATSWRDVPALVAELFGLGPEQAALDAGLDARLDTFRAALAAKGPAPSFTFVQVEAPQQFWVYTGRTFGPELALSAGLRLADNVLSPADAANIENGGLFAYPVSLEQTGLLEADHIFVYASTGGAEAEAMLTSTELGRRFAEANAGHIHYLNGQYWFNASAFAAHRVLDDLIRDVLQVDPAVFSPNPYAQTYQPAP